LILYYVKFSFGWIQLINPTKGKLVIFEHKVWHKGNKVTSGKKYVLRYDFIFNKSSNNHHQGYKWSLKLLDDNTFLSGGRDAIIKHRNKDLEWLKSINIHNKSIINISSITNQ
jgi:hypothetical protein